MIVPPSIRCRLPSPVAFAGGVLGLVLVVPAAAGGGPKVELSFEPPPTATVATDFLLEDINPASPTHGKKLALRDLWATRGLVLEFVASWCEICRDKLPELEALAARGAPIVYIAADEYGGPENMIIVAERAKLAAPVLFAPEGLAEKVSERYPSRILPTAWLIDSRGKVKQVFEGAVEGDALMRTLDAALDSR